MNIKTITFHRAQNHGSVLQTYALKEFVTKTLQSQGIDNTYEIIDYSPETQSQLYSIFQSGISLKSCIKNIIALRYYQALKNRQISFNTFLDKHLNLTKLQYSSSQQLRDNLPQADLYISGSDQIWNVRSRDFSMSYYFDFLPEDKLRISFATSFGPLKIDWDKYDAKKIGNLLRRYKNISVREDGSADNVEHLIGYRPLILADPTFLLTRDEWSKVENKSIKEKHPYILLYALEPTKEQLRIVRKISKQLSLPVIVLRYNNKNDWFNTFEKRYAAGPAEFLSYISQASLVLTSSFHGTAFSIIYNKPFYVLNGSSDARIKSILQKSNLISQSIDDSDIDKVSIELPDFTQAHQFIENNLNQSVLYIINSMSI